MWNLQRKCQRDVACETCDLCCHLHWQSTNSECYTNIQHSIVSLHLIVCGQPNFSTTRFGPRKNIIIQHHIYCVQRRNRQFLETETWFGPSIKDIELFSTSIQNVWEGPRDHRRSKSDICCQNALNIQAENAFNSNCEIILAKITVRSCKTLHVCSFTTSLEMMMNTWRNSISM